MMKKSNFALTLQPSLLDEARRIAADEDVALNQLINVAVAEKLAAIRTEAFFRKRAKRADTPEALRVLDNPGGENPTVKGDELSRTSRTSRVGHKTSRKAAKAS
jgi:hypothetical protein